jgi:hypothetical protein
MKQAKYIVQLTEEERIELQGILRKGKHSNQKIKRARILLELDKMSHYQEGPKRRYMPTHVGIAGRCGVNEATVSKISKQYVEEGYEATITRKKRESPPIRPIIDGEAEARIIALACSTPPPGYARWTLRLLESKVVELGIVEKVSDTTIGRTLKKRNLSHI